MNTYIKRYWVVVLLPIFLLSGCIDSKLESGSNSEQSKIATAFFDDDGAAVQIVDARTAEAWVYFDLETFSVIFPDDPLNDTDWDLAFQRFKVKVNGGVNGSAGIEVAALKNTDFLTLSVVPLDGFVSDRLLSELPDDELLQLGDNIFFSVCAKNFDDEEKAEYCLANDQVDREHLNPNESAFAFLTQGSGVVKVGKREVAKDGDPILGWYDYFQDDGHLLVPTADTWVIRSSQGIEFSLQMLGYYGYQEGDAESGTIAFRYLSMDPGFQIPLPGDQQLLVAATVDAVSGIAPLNIIFQGEANGVVGTPAWSWDFGDGATDNVQNPEHVYTVPGIYTATLTVTDDRGVAVFSSVIITVAEAGALPPTANAGSDQNITLGAGETDIAVSLDGSLSDDTDGVIVSYVWTGMPDPDDVESPVVQLGAGGYNFMLTVTDDNGNAVNDNVIITVNPSDNQLPVAIAILDNDSGAAPLLVTFTGDQSNDPDVDGSIVNWHWDFGDGTTSDGVANPPAHNFSPGVYDVVLTVTDDKGATNTASLIVQSGYGVVQDTYVYEFLGNQADAAGDSGNILVWRHDNVHGGKALIQFDNEAITDAATLGTGNYTAALHLYQVCELEGFVAACPGDVDTDNPFTPGIATVKVDIILQDIAWLQEDAALAWNDINEISSPFVTLTLSSAGGWSSIDVTALVNEWVAGATDFGFSLSQEAYPVIRTDTAFQPVAAFCDSESSSGVCATGNFLPYLVIQEIP